VYEYNELSDTAKDNVRSKYIGPGIDLEYIIDAAKEDGEKLGFNIDEVAWSGFSSQGDGASWTGDIFLRTFIEQHMLNPDGPNYGSLVTLLELCNDGWIEDRVSVSRKGYMYNHSGTMRIDQVGFGYVMPKEGDTLSAASPLQGANVRELYDGIEIDGLLEQIYEAAIREAKRYADKIYADLESAYDFEMGDERIAEIAEINGWQFDETGRIV
jgi:hypothetical protein